ncbi:MAG TPA: amino acid adenylation domain-containing protein [Polyangiales bacterium]|nr:amino acid adenylation domain-containing protein [Polyangiales bacterium]
MMNETILLELDCTTPEAQAALTLGGPSTAPPTWSLGALLDFLGAVLAERTDDIRFSVRIESLPRVADAATLRVSVSGGRVFRLRYEQPGCRDVWSPCLRADRIADALRLPEPDTNAARLALAMPEEGVAYVLHPCVLGAALDAAKQQLGAEVRRIDQVVLVAPIRTPATLLVEPESHERCRAYLFDDAGDVVAYLGGIGSSSAPLVSVADLARLAEETLGRSVAADESLLAGGASSLDLVRFANAIFEVHGVALALPSLLANPTLEQLCALIERGADTHQAGHAKRLDAVIEHARASGDDVHPLHSMQRAVWLASCQPNAASSYVESAAFRLRGPLQVEALERAWQELARRYESCRSCVVQRGGEFYQRLLPVEASALRLVTGAQRDDWLRARAAAPFGPDEPLARVELLRIAADDHVLLLAGHHAMFDGRSLCERVLPELAAAYAGEVRARSAARLEARHLASFEQLPESRAEVARTNALWRSELEGAPLAVDLSALRPPAAEAVQRGARHRFQVPHVTYGRLRELARRERCSLFALGLTVFRAALYRWAELDDVVIGVPVAQTWSPRFQAAVGCFVDLAPVRARADGETTLRELLAALQGCLARAIERSSHAPYAHLAANAAALPAIGVGFACEDATPRLQLQGLALERLELPAQHAKLELLLRLECSESGLVGNIEYRKDLLDAGHIEQLAARYTRVLNELSRGPDSLAVRLRELAWLSNAERQTLLAHARGPELRHDSALEQLGAAFAVNPQGIAVIAGSEQRTYRELDGLANALAQRLLANGVRRGQLVAVEMETGVHFPAAFLGCLRAGACFVPIDPSQPDARVGKLLDDAGIALVVTLTALHGQPALRGRSCILLDTLLPAARPPDAGSPPAPSDLAYGMFTSGSTGTPKLALNTHAGLANLLSVQKDSFGLQPGSPVLQFAAPAFDGAIFETMFALGASATLVTVPSDVRYDGGALFGLLREHRVRAAALTPSVLQTLPSTDLPELELLLVAGERCPAELVARWAVGRRMFNSYGPAEAAVCAAHGPCLPDGAAPALGRPIANVRTYVLDRDSNLVPIGQSGEICIAGAAVGGGYHNAPELSAARFVADPYGEPGDVLYRTGDRGKLLPDGRLVFLGRQDEQVKLRGRRVELGEVEAALREQIGVLEAVVVIEHALTPAARLVAYVTTACAAPCEGDLRRALAAQLPRHAVPSRIVRIAHWPRLPSGKIDRRALAALPPAAGATALEWPETALEQAVARAMAGVLGLDPASLDRDADFLAHGGHSLNAISLADALNELSGKTLPLTELLANPTVREIAARLGADQEHVETASRSHVAPQEREALARDSRLGLQATALAAPRADWRTVLLTGATGGLGRALLAVLLRQTRASIVCLVRASSDAEAQARLAATLEQLDIPPGARSRVRGVAAQLEQARLGLTAEHYERLSHEVDAILHCAAAVNFVLPYARLRAVNVEATRALIAFAFDHRSKALHYVSSLAALFPSVAAQTAVLREAPGPEPELLSLGYGRSKAVSERLLAAAAAQGLPVRIYRPSRLCATTQTAAPSADLLSYFLRACVQLGCFPNVEYSDNLLPTETAASLIVEIAQNSQLSELYYHIAHPHSTASSLFVRALRRAGYPLRVVEHAEWHRQLRGTELAVVSELFGDRALQHGLPAVDISNTRAAVASLDIPPIDLRWLTQHLASFLGSTGTSRAA